MIVNDCGGVWLDWPHVITLFDDDGNERDYLPGRTCRLEHDGYGWWECDECGATIDWDSAEQPPCDYCPSCGAKVINDGR